MPFPVKFLRETALLVDLIGDEIQLAYVGSLFILLPEKLDELQINFENEDIDEKENAIRDERQKIAAFLLHQEIFITKDKGASDWNEHQKKIGTKGDIISVILFHQNHQQTDKKYHDHFGQKLSDVICTSGIHFQHPYEGIHKYFCYRPE